MSVKFNKVKTEREIAREKQEHFRTLRVDGIATKRSYIDGANYKDQAIPALEFEEFPDIPY
jgi:hypothetical protein